MLLRDVMDHAVKVHKEITAPFGPKKSNARPVTLGILCAALIAVTAYSWLERPEFIWGPKAQPLSATDQEAGLRIAMFFAAQRVDAYRQAQGGLPSTLAAIGESLPGITYNIVGDTVFEMRTRVGGKAIVFRSDQSADDFLGNSANVIQGFGRP